jgi:hypothetical protein
MDTKSLTDDWLIRLKCAYDVGYYKTEAAEGMQTTFPWQNKTCQDCPFWSNSICQVNEEYRSAAAHTCLYFDPWNRQKAKSVIQERQQRGFQRWWDWYNDRGATR